MPYRHGYNYLQIMCLCRALALEGLLKWQLNFYRVANGRIEAVESGISGYRHFVAPLEIRSFARQDVASGRVRGMW